MDECYRGNGVKAINNWPTFISSYHKELGNGQSNAKLKWSEAMSNVCFISQVIRDNFRRLVKITKHRKSYLFYLLVTNLTRVKSTV